jgi:hypothetical protein
MKEEETPQSAEEALYGAVAKPPPPAPPKKEAEHRRHHHRHGAKPFSQESTYKPYMLVGAVSVALVLILFLISK